MRSRSAVGPRLLGLSRLSPEAYGSVMNASGQGWRCRATDGSGASPQQATLRGAGQRGWPGPEPTSHPAGVDMNEPIAREQCRNEQERRSPPLEARRTRNIGGEWWRRHNGVGPQQRLSGWRSPVTAASPTSISQSPLSPIARAAGTRASPACLDDRRRQDGASAFGASML